MRLGDKSDHLLLNSAHLGQSPTDDYGEPVDRLKCDLRVKTPRICQMQSFFNNYSVIPWIFLAYLVSENVPSLLSEDIDICFIIIIIIIIIIM